MQNNSQNNRSIGTIGENFAITYLEKSGYIIKDRNFRVGKIGEIDIIASLSNTLCFIEVKTRKNLSFGTPAESIVPSKIKTIRLIASMYLTKINLTKIEVRFDVMEVYLINKENIFFIKEINHIKNAF